EYAAQVGDYWGQRETNIRSWWQSPVVLSELRRRVTGDPEQSFEQYFRERYCPAPFHRALSLGAGGGHFERALLDLGVCEEILGVDISRARVDHANALVPEHMRGRLTFACENLEVWRPSGRFDLLIARDVLHHISRLEELCEALTELLLPGALLYVDEFVGPTRFQWTDKQLQIIGRLLDRLSPELVTDLVLDDGTLRRRAIRPTVENMIAADPSESVRSEEIPAILAEHFELVELRPYGGAVFHQLFNRLMGNFAGHDDLVRVLMELDFLLTDEGVLPTNYQWAVYRRAA
ncbi:MAG TPA: class I SAM-dependent methyltransferase, partial [Solirubrobacteraceae bacterium]